MTDPLGDIGADSPDHTCPLPAGRSEVRARIEDFAKRNGLEAEAGARAGEIVVVLPGEQKLKTVCSLLIEARDMSLSAFVIRRPDEEHERVYRHLLRRNLRLPGLAYAIDGSGDVYVVGRLPFAAVDEDGLDRLFGVVLDAADASFNDLLAMGFLNSMRREWRWRVDRGESLRNLEAFRHLLDDGKLDDGQPAASAATTEAALPPGKPDGTPANAAHRTPPGP